MQLNGEATVVGTDNVALEPDPTQSPVQFTIVPEEGSAVSV